MTEKYNHWSKSNIIWSTLLTILCVACFPFNLLVILGIIEPGHNSLAYWIGWVVWLVGMLLIISPMILFPKRGKVPKGKAFVHTTNLVTTGIYRVVRHPQYIGGILAVFVTTMLLYPHWVFAVFGVIGTAVVYFGSREEDKRLLIKFGDNYKIYMKNVPGMNILLGIFRLIKRNRQGYKNG